MSFGLVTAINVEDVPLIMRLAARNYNANAANDKEGIILERKGLREHHPELWSLAAQLLQQCADMLEAQIKETKARQPVVQTRRAVL